MRYGKISELKNGEELLIRNGRETDGGAVLRVFNAAHAETDFLLTYPEENSFTEEQEAAFLKQKEESEGEIELLAFVNGRLAGTAGIDAIGNKIKIRHRAEFGISILREFWGAGIGRALTEAAIDCARKAGYSQLELEVVADNTRAAALYKSLGFQEYGRNPRGFLSRDEGYQELVHMRLEL